MSASTHQFVAERRAAQHCAELIARGPDPAELAPRWEALGTALATALGEGLAPLMGGKAPTIEASAAAANLPGLAAFALYVREGIEGPLQLGIEGSAVLRLVDRAFGGRGEAPQSLPTAFPPSATMLVQKLEGIVTAALASVFGCGDDQLTVRLRTQSAAALPLRPGTSVSLTLTVRDESGPSWTIAVSLPQAALAGWLGSAPRRAARGPQSADPAAAPFADVPLPLSALLVDMQVPLSTIARLEPGMVLPVAVARAVPVSIGGHSIARGTVGTQDDRVAIKLTHIA